MPRTLLFADDSVTMRRVVELTFAEQGLKVISVSDGQQAIDQITSEPPALALISVSLQRVNGFDVARFVRDHVKSSLPVLLLAGAFDQLDDARVRESGAAGVLVKPFEPAAVIKRVKELLGMKTPIASPAEATLSPGATRLVTSDLDPRPAAAADGDVALPASGDYFTQLDAAFESLDAQISEGAKPGTRALSGGAGTTGPAQHPPGVEAVNGAPHGGAKGATTAAGPPAPTPSPVFEVDTDWFAKTPADAGADDAFVVTRASDYTAPAADNDRSWAPEPAGAEMGVSFDDPPPAPAPAAWAPPGDAAAHGEPPVRTAERSDLPGDVSTAAHDDTPAAFVPPDASVIAGRAAPAAPAFGHLDARDLGGAPSRPSVGTPSFASGAASPVAASLGSSGPAAPASPGFGAADAFAMLWAQEQGEAPPPNAVPAPVDLSEQSISALASQLTDRVSARLGAQLLEPLATDVGDRVSAALAARVTADANDRAPRLASDLAERMAGSIAERLTEGLSDRLAEGLAARVAELVAERMMQSALGDRLHQTVNEVAERVVRAEIERIRTAAESRRPS